MQPKRLIISVLVVILMLGVAATSVAAAEGVFEVAVEANFSTAILNNPTAGKAGDNLDVTVNINSNPGVAYFTFFLEYDPEALTINTNEGGDIEYVVGDVVEAEDIKVFVDAKGRTKCVVDMLDLATDNKSTGTLIKFSFKVSEAFDGQSDVKVNMTTKDITNKNWDDINVNVNNLPTLEIHAFADPETVKADCTHAGTVTYKCTKCDKVIVVETDKALGHTEVADPEVAPTCTKNGLTAGSHCSVCGEVIKAQEEIPALGHKEVVDAAVEATCTKTGLTEGSHCSVCGEVIKKQEEVPAKGHTVVVDAAVDATCTNTGLTEGSHCSVCGEVLKKQEVVPAKGHTAGDWVTDKEPTCTEKGSKHQVCSVCGQTLKTEEIPAKGHVEVKDEAVEPTYTKTGLTEGSHCSVCGEVLKAQEEIAKKSSLWIWLVSIAGVLAVAAVVVVVIFKKKK